MSFVPYVEAEYESGYVLREDEIDISPYDRDRNVFHAVLHKRPCDVHGPMVRFSIVLSDGRQDVDWKILPERAKPICFKHKARDFDAVSKLPLGPVVITGVDFGYEYIDDNGEKVSEIIEIR